MKWYWSGAGHWVFGNVDPKGSLVKVLYDVIIIETGEFVLTKRSGPNRHNEIFIAALPTLAEAKAVAALDQ